MTSYFVLLQDSYVYECVSLNLYVFLIILLGPLSSISLLIILTGFLSYFILFFYYLLDVCMLERDKEGMDQDGW